MKKFTLSLLTIGLLFGTTTLNAQAKKAGQPKKTATKPVAKKEEKKKPTQDEMMKAWEIYSTPGQVHEMLAKSNGEWKSQILQWMEPGADPMKSEGTCNNKMIMGGRYQQSEFKGNMMGMPFEGMSILGYDNAKQVFISTWIDNMGTGVTTMEGKWDEKTRSITFKGKMVNPMTGEEENIREVFTIKDENTQVMEMYSPSPDGKGEFKTMEITFTR